MENSAHATPQAGQAQARQLGTFSRRSFLLAGSAAAILAALHLSPQKANAADSSFAQARAAWQASLIGSDYDPHDPAVSARLQSLAAAAAKWQASMLTDPSRTALWTDLPLGTKSANLTSTARRLRDMAIGWAAAGSATYQNGPLLGALIDGLDWFTSNAYSSTTSAYDNWYEWMVSTPQALNDTAVLLFDQLTAAQIGAIGAAQAKQVPQMPTTGTQAAAANLALIADGFSGRGVLTDDMPTVAAALASVTSLLAYAQPVGGTVGLLNGGNVGGIAGGENEVAFFSHDGFYPDGSFIQHGQFPYAGGYGASFLTSLVATIIRTAPLGSTMDTSIVYDWIHDSFEPFLWNGLIMDTVSGRNVALSASGDHSGGHGILAACLPLLSTATGATRQRLAAMLKQELGSDTAHDPTSNFSLASLTAARTLLADATTAPRGPLAKTQVFGAMDRVVHRTGDFAAALAMNSLRISNYETGSGENLAGWYTADGALYLYNKDLAQFDDGYWFTVDPYRIPGTTVDRVERTRATVPWKAEYHNPDYWAGGVAASVWGAAGLRLTAQQPSSLSCRKSWFFFGSEILCLGDGISAAAGRTTETILENRRTTSAASAAITIDGQPAATAAGTSETVPNARWAHLEGVAGFVFAAPTGLNAQRETRSGTLSDISPKRTSAPASNTFSTLWLDHTASGTDAYGYVVLPNASADSTRQYAGQSPIRILAQAETVHAARHETSGRWAATFFAAGSASYATAAQPCALAIEELDTEIVITLSDPTQTSTEVVIDLGIASGPVLSADPGVTASRVRGKTRITADVADAIGASRTIRIGYVFTVEMAAERLKELNASGALAKQPYQILSDLLKDLERSNQQATALAAFRAALAKLESQIGPAEYAQIEDLASRLVARTP